MPDSTTLPTASPSDLPAHDFLFPYRHPPPSPSSGLEDFNPQPTPRNAPGAEAGAAAEAGPSGSAAGKQAAPAEDSPSTSLLLGNNGGSSSAGEGGEGASDAEACCSGAALGGGAERSGMRRRGGAGRSPSKEGGGAASGPRREPVTLRCGHTFCNPCGSAGGRRRVALVCTGAAGAWRICLRRQAYNALLACVNSSLHFAPPPPLLNSSRERQLGSMCLQPTPVHQTHQGVSPTLPVHPAGLTKWLEQKATCPVCRVKVTDDGSQHPPAHAAQQAGSASGDAANANRLLADFWAMELAFRLGSLQRCVRVCERAWFFGGCGGAVAPH